MQVPVQITFRGLPHSDAVKEHIEEKIAKLQHYCKNIISCHVVTEFENKNQRRGNLYNTHIIITVPGKELASTHNEDTDLYISIRVAFDDITRQLEEYVRDLRDGRNHQSLIYGKIVRLFNGDGFGFIESEDGTEYYFNANHVSHPDFHKLSVGMPVHFIQEMGHDGPQAHRVKLVDKQAE
jgi:ribosomal subunit interface protein